MEGSPLEAVGTEFAKLQSLYAQIEESARLGVWEWDVESGAVTWSAGLYRVFGVAPGRFKPSYDGYIELLHPDERQRVRNEIAAALNDRRPFAHDETVVLTGGETRHVRTWGRPAFDADGQVRGLVGVCQDVTETELARRRAEAVEAQLRARIESSASDLAYQTSLLTAEQDASLDGILVVDPGGRIVDRNRRFAEMWGIPDEILALGSDEKALEVALEKLIQPEAFLARVRWLYSHPAEKSFETLELRDGRTFERYSSPIVSGASTLGRVWFFRDISPRLKAERTARRQTEKLARSAADLEMYAAAAAQDLSAPLRKVASFAELLERRARRKLEPDDLQIVSRIRENATRLTTLVQSLLILSRVGRGEGELVGVPLGAMLEDVRSDLEIEISEAGAELVVGPLPEVVAQWTLMELLLRNLLSNALKFKASDRPLRIEIASRKASDGGAEIWVQDNGIGFDPARARDIFEPFRRLHPYEKYEGSGVGLAICDRIALRYGWRLTAEGDPGRGARFTLRIPAASIRARR